MKKQKKPILKSFSITESKIPVALKKFKILILKTSPKIGTKAVLMAVLWLGV
ncbi:hypothetical protein [Helicobacter pylori]|uniref:hypothetical protein n=1 Tax=Helicobacter pylori TaxID=210 RepID=UPI0013CE2D24|nr:hypothetical protein [Helicobacter pylori]